MATEQWLIDANVFRDWLSKQKRIGKNLVIMMLDETPTVDAVPVVRCKDCKHWRNSGNNIFGSDYGTCVECLMDTQQEHFCSYGERRTE